MKRYERMSKAAIIDTMARRDCTKCPIVGDKCDDERGCEKNLRDWLYEEVRDKDEPPFTELRSAMRRCGYTVVSLADDIGISPNTLHPKIAGKIEFKRWEMFAIADLLGGKVDNLFRE